MILLIAGASHTGKTALAQRLLNKYNYPYFSLDWLKMGLIRSGYTALTPMDDDKLTDYLWPITREMIKTAVENRQNLIIEGCYIPYDWAKDFTPDYQREIKYVCLVMSEKYIRAHFGDIRAYAGVVEDRGDDEDCTLDFILEGNRTTLEQCQKHGAPYLLIEDEYAVDFDL